VLFKYNAMPTEVIAGVHPCTLPKGRNGPLETHHCKRPFRAFAGEILGMHLVRRPYAAPTFHDFPQTKSPQAAGLIAFEQMFLY
jgi:hypothetical protein